MRASSFSRELVRSITRKPGRFLALLAIVALGAGFYAGLRMTAPDMKLALDRYFDQAEVFDVRVVGTYGLTDDDVDAISQLQGVQSVMPAYEVDALALFGEAGYTVRIHSFPAAAADSAFEGQGPGASGDEGQGPGASGTAGAGTSSGGAYLNRLQLVEGSWPTRPDECLVSADRVTGAESRPGDVIELTQGASDLDDALVSRTFTVTGTVRSSYYVSSANLDASTLGSGVVQQVLYVPEAAFSASQPYAELFVAVSGAADEVYGVGEGYARTVDAVKERIEGIADERCAMRLEQVTNELYRNALTYGGLLDLAEYRLSRTHDEFVHPAEPEWLVMGREKSAGTLSFSNDSDRVDHIARVFPFIFFLVAALVALTTMTRMVDEERLLAGTYKALGYSRAKIASKYLLYAALASVAGSVAGIAVLARLLPGVIMNAYAIIYTVPTVELPIDWPIALASAGAFTAITLAATWLSIAATLRERPAALLLPKVTAMGKRIVLERAKLLWSRLSFTWKVTFRNIFRYKKRFVMTVIGIAGCTALLLTGLGLHDSINDIIDVQYGQIINHNTAIALDEHLTGADEAAFDQAMADRDLVLASTDAYAETMLASGPRAQDKRIDLVVPFDPEAFGQMKLLRTRVGHEPVKLRHGTAALNEKMAQELGIGVGDTITLNRQDAMGNATSESYDFVVGALVENYIYNYLYVDVQTYREVFGRDPARTAVYANVSDDAHARVALDERLSSIDGVKTVTFNDETIDTYRRMLRSVDLIVVVLVVSAAALAFIVLYNLTNINIEERIREIATLKVLGFTRGETNAYIFREIAILALFGCIVGLGLGVYLESFVVVTAEVDQVMFGRSVHAASYAGAFALTMAFSALAMVLMLPKLRRVDMVESLKSNE